MLKSFLHQSSDLNKAISEAWQQSSCPAVFTVKVIDAGKKGFLGFAHRPATISFTYENSNNKVNPGDQLRDVQKQTIAPQKTTPEKMLTTDKFTNKAKEATTSTRKTKTAPSSSNSAQQSTANNHASHKNNSAATITQEPRARKEKESSNAAKTTTGENAKNAKAVDNLAIEHWTEPLAQQAADWLNNFCTKFANKDITVVIISMQQEQLSMQINPEMLVGTTLENLFNDNLFACACATLIVQSLRNRSSQRFRGLKIKITA